MQAGVLRFVLLIGIGIFGTCGVAVARWPHRVDLDLLGTSTDTFAGSPWSASDGSGGVFLAWDDNRNSALTGRDIYIQRFNSEGVPQWNVDGIAVVTANESQVDPIVVSGGSDSVFVVWADSRLPNSPRVYVQRFNGIGQRQWSLNGVRSGSNEFAQTRIAAVGDPAGNLFIVWAESSNNFRTFVQKFDATGTPLFGGSGVEFSSGVFDGGSAINVISDGAGGAVVGWIQYGDNPRTVWVQRILSDGSAAYDPVGFGNDTHAMTNLLPMAPDGAGGVIVGWQSDHGTDENLYMQRVDGSGGLPWGAPSRPLVDQPGVQDNLSLVTDTQGGVFAAWDDLRTGTDNVYVQRVTSTGTMGFTGHGIAVGESVEKRSRARLMADGTGNVIVAYHENKDGIHAQKIAADGRRLWGSTGVPVTDNSAITEPRITSDGNAGAILSVIAFANGNRPALKRILANGRLTQARLVNISTRAYVGTGAMQAIPGFVVAGAEPKTALIRAIGPTLGGFGVNGALVDPALKLFDGPGQEIAERDDWASDADVQLIADTSSALGAFALAVGSKDSALVRTLPISRYTASVVGVDDTDGVALLEIYDADPAGGTSYLANLSSRVFVGSLDQQAIPGFVIGGNGSLTLLIRAIGPTLGDFGVIGVLEDPVLMLHDATDAVLASNDDWSDAGAAGRAEIAGFAERVGAFALSANSLDSALLVTLEAGRYTALARGTNGGTGVCLIELYVVP